MRVSVDFETQAVVRSTRRRIQRQRTATTQSRNIAVRAGVAVALSLVDGSVRTRCRDKPCSDGVHLQ